VRPFSVTLNTFTLLPKYLACYFQRCWWSCPLDVRFGFFGTSDL